VDRRDRDNISTSIRSSLAQVESTLQQNMLRSSTSSSTAMICSRGRRMLLDRHAITTNGAVTMIAMPQTTVRDQYSDSPMMQMMRWPRQQQQQRMLSFESFFAEQSSRRNRDAGDDQSGNANAKSSMTTIGGREGQPSSSSSFAGAASDSSSNSQLRRQGPSTDFQSSPPVWRNRHHHHQQQQYNQRQQHQQHQQYQPMQQQHQQHQHQNQSDANYVMDRGRQQQPPMQPPLYSSGIENRRNDGEGGNDLINNHADIRDISQLRNTFLKHPNQHPHRRQQQQQQPQQHLQKPSWRTNAAVTSGSTNYQYGRQRQGGEDGGWGNTATGVGTSKSMGTRWADPPVSPQLSSSSSGAFPNTDGVSSNATNNTNASNNNNNGVKSMEQIMKENAIQRQQSMEQRYVNAGQRVPYNSDEYGNARPGGEGKVLPSASSIPAWRNRNYNGGGRNWNNYNGGRGQQQFQQQQQQQSPSGQGWQRQQRPTTPTSSFQNKNNNKRQQRQRQQLRNALPSSIPKEVRLPSTPLTLVDLSLLLRVRKRTIVRALRSLGERIAYSTANQDSYTISVEMMEYICVELGVDPIKAERKESDLEKAERRALRRRGESDGVDESAKTEEEERYASLPRRSPVVSIMGHVDHGKTTLMDALRRRAVTGMSASKGGAATTSTAGKRADKKQSTAKSRGKGGVNVTDGNVAGTEAGGITQVITAFEVPLPLEEGSEEDGTESISTVCFLDTPGHAAFKKMRQSGSLATDVIVLVVAADDGVSPQTVEIIDMFKSIARSQPQSISLVIAVSKIDKPGIDIDESVMRIENQLMEHEIYTENVLAGGGDEGEFGACQLFPVSGITGEGLDDLVEGLALQSEIMDLRADEEAKGEGIVIDARMEKGLGVVADCVIRWGSVAKGDFVVSGTHGGRVKFLNDVANKPLAKARPSQPVRIVGFKSLPKAGDPIVCAKSEDEAKELIRLRESELINEERAEYENDIKLQVMGTAAKQGTMMQKAQQKYGYDVDDDDKKDDSIYIPVVIKADSHGTLEAVRDALVSIGTDSKLNIVIDPVEMSTGVVTTSDVVMARESDAAIFTFGTVGVADKETKNLAEHDGVSIRNHNIIYRLLEDAKEFFTKYLPIQLEEKIHGRANVQAVFEVTDAKKQSVSIAGLRVADGYLFKSKSKPGSVDEVPLSCFFRVLRNGKLLSPDVEKLQASSLRKVKEDVESVKKGEECGLGLTGFNDLVEGDVVECFSIEEKRAAL